MAEANRQETLTKYDHVKELIEANFTTGNFMFDGNSSFRMYAPGYLSAIRIDLRKIMEIKNVKHGEEIPIFNGHLYLGQYYDYSRIFGLVTCALYLDYNKMVQNPKNIELILYDKTNDDTNHDGNDDGNDGYTFVFNNYYELAPFTEDDFDNVELNTPYIHFYCEDIEDLRLRYPALTP